MYPKTIKELIEFFSKLPGIGEKTAERLSFYMMNYEKDEIDKAIETINNIKNIKKCKNCNNLTEEELCYICNDKERDSNILCIVEDVKNLIMFEKIGSFKGKYHVLEKLISPLNAIGPEDLNIEKIKERINKEKIKEVIIALKSTIEGETTALYLNKILDKEKIIISKIAQGVPLGTDMEYLDPITLETAISNRKKISE